MQVVADRAPRASLIIVNYNGRDDLDRCLQSLEEAGEADYELILVDNASSDGSADHVAAHYPQVRLIRSEVNLGFGAGNNLGAAQARGEYLAFLNPDTTMEPWACTGPVVPRRRGSWRHPGGGRQPPAHEGA